MTAPMMGPVKNRPKEPREEWAELGDRWGGHDQEGSLKVVKTKMTLDLF